ncbi:hypothetical protein D3C85_923550 [compost metagenome]
MVKATPAEPLKLAILRVPNAFLSSSDCADQSAVVPNRPVSILMANASRSPYQVPELKLEVKAVLSPERTFGLLTATEAAAPVRLTMLFRIDESAVCSFAGSLALKY